MEPGVFLDFLLLDTRLRPVFLFLFLVGLFNLDDLRLDLTVRFVAAFDDFLDLRFLVVTAVPAFIVMGSLLFRFEVRRRLIPDPDWPNFARPLEIRF